MERTRPFYIGQFEALKAFTAPEVSLCQAGNMQFDKQATVGTQKPENHYVCPGVVSSTPRCTRLSKGDIQE